MSNDTNFIVENRRFSQFFSLIIILIHSFIFADYTITRGSDIGEIYYIANTLTGKGIYHSTDFGETATCMDSIDYNIYQITADLTPGVIYGKDSLENLYISYDYGLEGSWQMLSNSNISLMHAGRSEGQIYNGSSQHSEDYGISFVNHQCQGYFGGLNSTEIDIEDNIGYVMVYESDITDSLFLLISYDNFESLEIQNSFNTLCGYQGFNSISRGYSPGELYMARADSHEGIVISELWYSDDYGENWSFKNYLLSSTIVGGHQPGEMYILRNYTQSLGVIAHTYIHHSLDYGETFTVYHTFDHGPDPHYTFFEASPTEGCAPLTVQFTDLSSGSYLTGWEWDFNNDGQIDSYEQHPEYTFQDSGYYTVTLLSYNDYHSKGYIKRNYIHVTNGSGINNMELGIWNYELSNYPNPFNPTTTISFEIDDNNKNIILEIFNIKGNMLRSIKCQNQNQIIWDGTDNHQNHLSSGIYLYRLKNGEGFSEPKKMLLLK